MKNKILLFLISFLVCFINTLLAEELNIESEIISIDKKKNISIFKNNVLITTEKKETIESNFAEYNKSSGLILLKDNIVATDKKNNKVKASIAEYNQNTQILETTGETQIITDNGYSISGKDIYLNGDKKFIKSEETALLIDNEGNKIYLENFEYDTSSNIFKSIGYIKIIDKVDNLYEFSQIYIDTEKKQILGTDIKSYLNNEDFKIDKRNKPRIFANSLSRKEEISSFKKSIFTLCNYRENDKCPPWTIQAKEMLHDNKKKTIYYDNALIKVYDIPIFYFPKLSHPDPSVDRRSGFLPPSFSDSKNLGPGVSIPYFWALNNDKNFTLTNKILASNNPLFFAEYHQAFKNSNLKTDFGYTKGYQKSSSKKKKGDKSHLFLKYVNNFNIFNNSNNTFNISAQNVSNDKYLKLYKIKSNLVDYNVNNLENSIDFTHEGEKVFFGLNSSMYETLKSNYNDKYEYIYPEIVFDKNLINNNKIGNIDLQTNYKVHKYDTNKYTNFLVNDLSWDFKKKSFDNGIRGKLLASFKNINYETKNVDIYKNNTTQELFGAFGYFSELELEKKVNETDYSLKPKLLLRVSPGKMRKEIDGSRLDPVKAFSMNRLDNINNFETGSSATVGFDYNVNRKNNDFDFSIAQVINELERHNMPTKSSLDEKLSDLVGSANYEVNDKVQLSYNFAVDQNYNSFNYNEIATNMNFNKLSMDFSYLQENKHIGDQEYFKTKLDYKRGQNGIFSFETKRNLVSDSSEFYNLSYEYLNDCLRAGLVYRREFYTDSELEPENSLMFKITLSSFGGLNSPSFNQ